MTITLPRYMIREAKHAAVDQGLSLSAFVAKVIQERIENMANHREAMEQELKIIEEGIPGFHVGEATWTREELHER